jgi:hypothetical protein
VAGYVVCPDQIKLRRLEKSRISELHFGIYQSKFSLRVETMR